MFSWPQTQSDCAEPKPDKRSALTLITENNYSTLEAIDAHHAYQEGGLRQD
jgi:hypothetical protein